MDGGAGCPAKWMYLMPLNCVLKNDSDGKFYVMCILLQLKKKKKKRIAMQISNANSFTGNVNLLNL